MAASGSKNFSVTRTDIVESAMRKTGQYDAGEAASAEEAADAVLALNILIKGWSARGIDLPWRSTITLFLQPGTQSYAIGPSGYHATSSYVETTLSTAEAAASALLGLTSTTGMTVNDHIGIKLDDGTIHWTTITNLGTGAIADALPSAAAAGNRVYAYTTKAYRPQKLIFVHRRSPAADDTPVNLIGEISYRSLSQKSAIGQVTQAYYSPTLVNGTLYVWPVNDRSIDKLVLIAQLLADDFDDAGDEPQFPIEWTEAMVWGLAASLGPEYGVSIQQQAFLEGKAAEMLNTMLDYDVENASVVFGREA